MGEFCEERREAWISSLRNDSDDLEGKGRSCAQTSREALGALWC